MQEPRAKTEVQSIESEENIPSPFGRGLGRGQKPITILKQAIITCNPDSPLTGAIHLPASKSISNRLLMLNEYSGNRITINGISTASDTVGLSNMLTQVSLRTENQDKPLVVDAGDAGTTFRFILPYLANMPGQFILTGTERMKNRPVGELVEVLKKIGADINYLEKENYPPLEIRGKRLSGGMVNIEAGVSSQFISSLLMIAPVLPKGIQIHLKNVIVSQPYIELTLFLMERLGVTISEDERYIGIEHQEVSEASFEVGKDWSAAAFWYSMAALSRDTDLFLNGLNTQSIQGDAILVAIYAVLGIETIGERGGLRLKKIEREASNFEFDFLHYPDLVPAVAVTCAALNIPAKLTGIRNLRIKESDRIYALENELNKMGFIAKSNPDELIITPTTKRIDLSKPVETYNDHRIAMAFAPLAVISGNICIMDPDVVKKSYPGFWGELDGLGFEVTFLK